MLDFAESPYYNITFSVLFSIGLWPKSNMKFATAQRILSAMILIGGMASLVLFFVNQNFAPVELPLRFCQGQFTWSLSLLTCVFLSLLFAFKYSSFYISAPKVITIMNRITDDLAMLREKGELRIIEKYMEFGRFLSKSITVIFLQPLLGFFLCSSIPCILAIGDPSDTPRRYKMPIVGLWFEEKYYYVIVISWGIQALLGVLTLAGTEASVVIFTQHACGMLSVACYRMRYALNEENQMIPRSKKNLLMCDRLIGAISIYQRAIELGELITITFAPTYIIFIFLGVTSMSLNLFRLSQEFMAENGWEDVIICLLIIASHFLYMFFGCCVAQEMYNHSQNMFVETYNTEWYMAPLPAAKLLLMILQRTAKSYTFAVSGIFVGSLEGFSKLMSISMSYFMFMYNVQ